MFCSKEANEAKESEKRKKYRKKTKARVDFPLRIPL